RGAIGVSHLRTQSRWVGILPVLRRHSGQGRFGLFFEFGLYAFVLFLLGRLPHHRGRLHRVPLPRVGTRGRTGRRRILAGIPRLGRSQRGSLDSRLDPRSVAEQVIDRCQYGQGVLVILSLGQFRRDRERGRIQG